MKLMLVRLSNGTFLGQIKTDAPHKLYFPAMVDFITTPVQGPLGRTGIQVITHLAKWPSHILTLEAQPILSSVFDADDTEATTDKTFTMLYRAFLKDHWAASVKIVN